MRRIIISLVTLTVFGATLTAQNKDTQKADRLFNRFEYVAAAQEYLKLAEKGQADSYVYGQLAEAYYNTYNPAEAVKWYARATETEQPAEVYYRYAQMLKSQGKYEESNTQMRVFAQKAPQDKRAQEFLSDPNYLPKLQDKQKLYDLTPLDINSDKSDFGALLHANTLYFASARGGSKTYGWNDEPYLDIYQASYNVDGTITNAEPLTALNTRWHEGPVTLSADGNTMYFSSESFNEKLYEKDKDANARKSRVNLFKATKTGDKWGNIVPLPFNSSEYSTGNPSLSKDGKTLYFASDMPGSIGGIDIWKVSVNDNGTYGTPENLGSKVNTEGDESFPFISEDSKTLYFASNGHTGFGGYDVFSFDGTRINNPGKPVNSEKDDFAFTFNTEKNIGFVSSNRAGTDNIYLATPVCGVDILTAVTDAKTRQPLSGAKVSILDGKNNVIATESSNSRGEVSYYAECDRAYTIQVSKDGYESASFPVAGSKGGQQRVNAALDPIEVIITETEVILKPIHFEFDKSNITAEGAFELDKLVQVMKQNPEMVIFAKAHTDNRGSDKYNQNLSSRRAQATVQYIISKGIAKERISGKGFGESEPKTDCKENCTEEQHAENRRSEFLIVKK